jgi:hypothetical protein
MFELSIDSACSSANSLEENKWQTSDKNKKSSKANVRKKQPKKGREKKGVDVCEVAGESLASEIPRDCGAELVKFSEKFNFSEFDSYSFVISDTVSPRVVNDKAMDSCSGVYPVDLCEKGPVIPWTDSPIKALPKSAAIETSTPNNAVTTSSAGHKNCDQSPSNLLNRVNLDYLEAHSPLQQCRIFLDRLSISQVEHTKPQLNVSHNDSSFNYTGNLSKQFHKSLQKVTHPPKRNRTNSSISVQSRVLDSIDESSFNASQDLFDCPEVDRDEVIKDKESEESTKDKDSFFEVSPSRFASAVTSSEQGGSFHTAASHQGPMFLSPHGRLLGKSIGKEAKELEGVCSVKVRR